jgi:hypothetical protein
MSYILALIFSIFSILFPPQYSTFVQWAEVDDETDELRYTESVLEGSHDDPTPIPVETLEGRV